MTDMHASRRVRAVVLGVLLVDVVCVTALAGWLVAPRGPAGWALVVVVLAGHGALHVLALRAAVSPWVEPRTRHLIAVGLSAATALAWPVLTAAARPDQEPWAWLLGFTVGALVVLWPWAAVGGSVGGAGLLVLGWYLWGGSLRDGLVFAAVAAAAAGGVAWLVVWMLRLLVSAEEGVAAQARLAVAEERLRVSRDLHDVLGHRLGVIALRAELAGDRETQEIARRTLADVREAVHRYGTLDLAEQLRGAELVLTSAGVQVTVDAGPVRLSAAGSQLLAAAVREAVTNILRHSDARHCRLTLEQDDGTARLTIINDGVPERSGDPATSDPARSAPPGTGLAGLAERAALVGGRLRVSRDPGRFRLTVEAPG